MGQVCQQRQGSRHDGVKRSNATRVKTDASAVSKSESVSALQHLRAHARPCLISKLLWAGPFTVADEWLR